MIDRAVLDTQIRAACDGERWPEAATLAIEGYGPEVLSYLRALARSETDAGDAFAIVCEQVWLSLPRFRWESQLRTWIYALARHTWLRQLRDPDRRRAVPLSDAPSRALATRVQSTTPPHLRTDVKDRLAEIRAELDPDDQTLLILRVDRELPWRDIAQVMSERDDDQSPAEIDRRAVALRKRFTRIKDDLRTKLRGA